MSKKKGYFSILAEFVEKVKLYLERVIGDYDHAAEGMRKSLAFNVATKVHQACGMFLFFLTKLEAIAPAAEFPNMNDSLLVQFKSTLMDSDLLHCLETQVPSNADLKACSGFRPGFFTKHAKQYLCFKFVPETYGL